MASLKHEARDEGSIKIQRGRWFIVRDDEEGGDELRKPN
jgi:hypothetical protein